MSIISTLTESYHMIAPYKGALWQGFLVTIELGILSLIVSFLIGTIVALGSFSRSRVIRFIVLSYTTIIRGIPDIVLIFLFYFGVQTLLNKASQHLGIPEININPFITGIITIGIIFGAFMAESIRGGLLAVSKGQTESALALGLPKNKVYIKIVIPQAMRFALPGLNNNWLVLLKATALVSLINLHDLVDISLRSGQSVRAPFTFLIVAAIGYLFLTAISNFIVKFMEKRLSHGIAQGDFYD